MRKAILGLGGLTAAALTFGLLASSGSAGATSGQWGGSAQWAEFFSPVLPNATLVPGSESGAIHPSSQWPDLMFPAGTQLTGGGNETYNYVYTEFGGKTNQQQWVDANFDNDGQSQAGQADFQGQITG